VPSLAASQSLDFAKADLAKSEKIKSLSQWELNFISGEQTEQELVVFFPKGEKKRPRLCYHVRIYPHLGARWEYLVDAHSGEIVQKFSNLCKLHHFHGNACSATASAKHENSAVGHSGHEFLLPPDGPKTATATDLLNQTRTLNTYESNGQFYLIDASKPMFSLPQSQFPNKPVGVVWTVNALNTSPANSNFNSDQVRSSNNTWSNKTSVSAHYNGGKAFEYFKNTFNRNSINDRNGNIVSYINVVEDDNTQMDNAFWNGAAIFYGNGNVAFEPLAKGLDIAGHEMAHGVIETTANLEYFEESGALNESFADIFGVMIDRDDWTVGEEVAKRTYFPTGAMRSMSNPHNGGNSFDDNGYQPKVYSERYRDSDDNGGVHINSGISNYAYYLFATNANVGKEKAEQVYYRALTKYLVKSSKFVDMRNAVMQAATDLHGGNSPVVAAAKSALDAAEFPGGSGSDYQDDLNQNMGAPYLLLTDADGSAIYLSDGTGNIVGNPLINIEIASKPSVTDNGDYAVFVGLDKFIYLIDFTRNQFNKLSNQAIWRNAAISKDGTKLAALTDAVDNNLYIADLVNGRQQVFELYNPTYSTGIQTADVEYADVIEWDYSGEWVMYDALNKLNSTFGSIDYWDIAFVNVWDKTARNFGDGFISKLFNGLPENYGVGNPTFAKNSPYIIAFDFFSFDYEEYYIFGYNLETGDVSDPPLFENTDLGVPNYTHSEMIWEKS
jgi:Zn-dependent metalloprotease